MSRHQANAEWNREQAEKRWKDRDVRWKDDLMWAQTDALLALCDEIRESRYKICTKLQELTETFIAVHDPAFVEEQERLRRERAEKDEEIDLWIRKTREAGRKVKYLPYYQALLQAKKEKRFAGNAVLNVRDILCDHYADSGDFLTSEQFVAELYKEAGGVLTKHVRLSPKSLANLRALFPAANGGEP